LYTLPCISAVRLALSPNPPRFLPTCSQYSIDSYKAHGVWKGTVLTAWRLMRCNPWGECNQPCGRRGGGD
jgi:putative membrane protein insertion efficiency factor